MVRRAVREGHLIANHTVSHQNLCAIDEDQAAREIDENRRAYRALTGLPIILFRTPYGSKCQRLRRMLAERSLDHTHWDIDAQEWRHHSSKRMVRFITGKLKHLEGRAVVLMHDTYRVTVIALPEILDWIEKENERRKKTGRRRPIRIINSVDYLSERLDTDVLVWAAESTTALSNWLQSAFNKLIP